MQRSFRSRLDRIRSNITWRRFDVVVLVLLVAAAGRVAYLLWPEWTGFGEKTLWDLLELLIIPAVLGFGALYFNQAARSGEQKIAEDQQREEALQNYLDKMAELLLKENLLQKKDNPEDPVVDVAQVRTVTTLRIIDWVRRNILFQFLRDANLADFILVKASLVEANLSHTQMYKINLSRADLFEADLSGAHLRGADLSGADLSGAHLSGAYLRGAKLSEARLNWANLIRADLSEAILWNANLSGVDLSGAILRGANLTGAKYDSQTQWPEDFDYESSGAVLGDE